MRQTLKKYVKFPMKRNYFHIFCYLIGLMTTVYAQNPQEKKWRSWDAPAPTVQLDQEAKDDIKGLGRLFVPVMTESDYEPVFTVMTLNDSIIKGAKMGTSVWLRPGKYRVALGSGTLDQIIKKVVEIRAEDTTILEPDWSCLVVRIIDETKNSVREAYEIYALPENEYFGVGYGADEQLGEHLQTWILRPGLYKIIKLGEHVNTHINFTTVCLQPGELIHYTIVINSETKDFLGAGILELGPRVRQMANWTFFGTLYGSYSLNSSNDVTTKKQETSMIVVVQFDYNLMYTTPHHFFSSRGLIEEGWNLQKKQATFRSYLDRAQFKNIYIFYFTKPLGLYSRLFTETNLVQKKVYYETPRTIIKIDQYQNIIERRTNVRQLELSPIFSPIELKQGLGINLILLKSLWANLNIRVGMGWHQIFNRQLFTQITDSTFKAKPSNYARGPEASLVGSARISRNMLLSCELEGFYPRSSQHIDYEFENILNLKLSKNLSMDYTLRFRNKKSLSDYLITEHLVLLRYSFFLF